MVITGMQVPLKSFAGFINESTVQSCQIIWVTES